MNDVQRIESKIDSLAIEFADLRIELEKLRAHQCQNPGACNGLAEREENLFRRVRDLEIWQAYKSGQISLITFVVTVFGVAIVGGVSWLIRHYK